MDDSTQRTIADLLAETDVIPHSDRDAALAWAQTLERDVRRAVLEASTARRLGALADVLDQRLVWLRFRLELDDQEPERAAANAELRRRGPDHPRYVRLGELAEQMRSHDPTIRASALRELAHEHTAFMESEIGQRLSARAADAPLDEQIESLRRALDIDRMIVALASRASNESDAERKSG